MAEYLDSLRYSRFGVRFVHVTRNARLDFDINEFDLLLQSNCARMPFVTFEPIDCCVSPDYQAKVKQFGRQAARRPGRMWWAVRVCHVVHVEDPVQAGNVDVGAWTE
jgi:Zn-finger protein